MDLMNTEQSSGTKQAYTKSVMYALVFKPSYCGNSLLIPISTKNCSIFFKVILFCWAKWINVIAQKQVSQDFPCLGESHCPLEKSIFQLLFSQSSKFIGKFILSTVRI